ncbi:hypothetical protein [Methanobrevibacter sp.]|uniref:hypothetical protein n=1 Tax=Methanobrevibacter sp. TaxID=66852 RepID=UPI0025EF93C1|nr:hypothetical protein [Methanobrevibacter sp.]MBQ6512163.1 hypothetical protein [Methanobrevibacter sp.]
MDKFVLRLDKAINEIRDADYILIGAGAGFSAAAGIEYSGKRFDDNFQDFIKKYGVKDMYSATFYPYETQEEKWAHWARHVYVNRYSVGKTKLYGQLLDLVKDKDYFVLTTNVEHQFWINGFEDERIFATQGDYGMMQCAKACHDKLYSNEELVFKAIESTDDCKIPSELVPVCPVCGGNMEINVRKDNFFVENEKWHEMAENYSRFLGKINEEDKLVLLELGVGFNTPVIIRYPFEQMTYNNPNVSLIRLNRSHSQAIPENKDKTISFDEDLSEIFDYWCGRI